MRLPSHLLAKLTLVGLAACEPAHVPEACEREPVVVENVERPAAAPRFAEPPPPQPQPIVKKKPKPRMVWENICGHTQLVEEKAALVDCGKG